MTVWIDAMLKGDMLARGSAEPFQLRASVPPVPQICEVLRQFVAGSEQSGQFNP